MSEGKSVIPAKLILAKLVLAKLVPASAGSAKAGSGERKYGGKYEKLDPRVREDDKKHTSQFI